MRMNGPHFSGLQMKHIQADWNASSTYQFLFDNGFDNTTPRDQVEISRIQIGQGKKDKPKVTLSDEGIGRISDKIKSGQIPGKQEVLDAITSALQSAPLSAAEKS